MHQGSLTAPVWQHATTILLQMLAKSDQEAKKCQLAAVMSIGRLLLHASDACSDQGQTEQLLAALVQTYIQPQPQHGSPLIFAVDAGMHTH